MHDGTSTHHVMYTSACDRKQKFYVFTPKQKSKLLHINHFIDYIPQWTECVIDVVANNNCGYRSVATLLIRDESQWATIICCRKSLLATRMFISCTMADKN